jgi:signal peptidase I
MNQRRDIKDQFIGFWKETGKEKILKIKGTSMLPLIREGDTLGVTPVVTVKNLKIGDIAVYKASNGIIAHRIIAKYKKGDTIILREKGDRGAVLHSITEQQIIGRVIKIYQPGKTLYLTNKKWILINRIIGHYWKIIFICFDLIVILKTALFGTKKFPVLSTQYHKLISSLVKLPTIMLRRR